jgi:hypothetical protein
MLTRARMYNVHVHKATARRQRPNRTPTHRNLSTWGRDLHALSFPEPLAREGAPMR